MRKIYRVAIGLGGILEGQAIVVLSIAIVIGLQSIDILIQDLIWAELLVSAKS